MSAVILTCNAGSTNTKLAAYDAKRLKRVGHAVIHGGAEEIAAWLASLEAETVAAIGHRVVHGGEAYAAPVRVTGAVMRKLASYVPLAPLHQPAALGVIEETRRRFPRTPQIACFDTAFHHAMPEAEQRLPLPRRFHEQGIRRYGFHGLSYQHIAAMLPRYAGARARGRVIVAHLGGGASACAMKNRRSVSSTMGFSTLDGLMMGTRCGALDPGVVLHLWQQQKMGAQEVTELLYHQSGLKGVSGISGDMRELTQSRRKEAAEAVALYCRLAARQIAGLVPCLGGLDALVFTGGVGEHAAPVREAICADLAWLGIRLSASGNAAHQPCITRPQSPVPAFIIPTDEEKVIAQACRAALQRKNT